MWHDYLSIADHRLTELYDEAAARRAVPPQAVTGSTCATSSVAPWCARVSGWSVLPQRRSRIDERTKKLLQWMP